MYYSEFIRHLERIGIEPDRARSYDVLILPENLASTEKAEELFQAVGATNLCKLLAEAGCNCASPFTFGLDVSALERRGADKWLGCVWIRDKVAIPLVVGTVASLLAMKIAKKEGTPEPSEPPPVVHTRIFIGDAEGGFSSINYDGDGATLVKMLEAMQDVRGDSKEAE